MRPYRAISAADPLIASAACTRWGRSGYSPTVACAESVAMPAIPRTQAGTQHPVAPQGQVQQRAGAGECRATITAAG